MQINFTLAVILNGAIIVLGVFAAIGLITRRHNVQANRLLAIFLICLSLWLVDTFMRIAGIYSQNPDYYFKPIYYSFAFGPLIYFYVRSLVNSEFRLTARHLWHFIPVLIQASLYIYLSFQDYGYKRTYWEEVHLPYTYRIEFDGTLISMGIYLWLSIKILGGYRKWLTDTYADISKTDLTWLRILLILMFILCGQWLIEVFLRDLYQQYYRYNYTVSILGMINLVLAYKAFYQTDQREMIYQGLEEVPSAQDKSINPQDIDLITRRMTEHHDYLDTSLSLKSFARNSKVPSRTISRYLNQTLGKNFHQYVNEYRVEAFKQKVASKEEQGMTLEGLAYDCGFNSKASFNRVFKSMTGLTPSQYVSKHVLKSS